MGYIEYLWSPVFLAEETVNMVKMKGIQNGQVVGKNEVTGDEE